MRSTLAHVLLAALVVLTAGRVQAQSSQMTLAPGSELRIEGTSTVNAFTCVAETMDGYGRLAASTPARRASLNDAQAAQAEISVPVQALDCGKKKMNEDLYEAMQAEDHPSIHYRLDDAEVIDQVGDDQYRLRVRGGLRLAGTERPVEMTVVGKRIGEGTYAVEGSTALQMTDFGIEPPTALLGLIKAHDRIVVHFDLVAECMATIAANYAPCE